MVKTGLKRSKVNKLLEGKVGCGECSRLWQGDLEKVGTGRISSVE